MSKAFTRESDLPEAPLRPRLASVLPPGTKNYLTSSGAARLRAEAAELQTRRAAIIASNGSADEQLHAIDARMVQLQETLQFATVVEPPTSADGVVRFGSTVSVRSRGDEETSYRIVGVDETDLDRNWVSWLSPIAKALINARVGQRVRFKFPSGEEELEILRVSYE